MAEYRVELHNGRRVIREETRHIWNLKDSAELNAVLGSMAKAVGRKPPGHSIRIYEHARNGWRKVKEVSA